MTYKTHKPYEPYKTYKPHKPHTPQKTIPLKETIKPNNNYDKEFC